MEKEGLVSRDEAVLMVEPRHLDQLLHPMFEGVAKPEYKKAVLGKGLPASPGAAVGKVVFTADDAEKWEQQGEKVGSRGGTGSGGACSFSRCAGCHAGGWARPTFQDQPLLRPQTVCAARLRRIVAPPPAGRSSWCGWRPHPRTWAACTPRRAS